MPWKEMQLRGKRVWMRCDETGQPAAQQGRVEIRYSPTQNKAYFAAVRNLQAPPGEETIRPDTDFATAEPVERSTSKARKPAAVKDPHMAVLAKTPQAVVCYTDGACIGNPGPAGLGIVVLEAGVQREYSEFLGQGTNNIAELMALLRAAETLNDAKGPIHIYTDSQYAIGLLTKGWQAKANQDLVAQTRAAFARLSTVELHHVRGHTGVLLNEVADTLATEAAEQGEGRGWIAKEAPLE